MTVYASPIAMTGVKNYGPANAKRRLVQWKETNVENGVVRVNEALLSRLIKKEPVQKYYRIDPVPLSTGMFSEVRRCRSIGTGQVYAAKFSSRLRYGEDCTKEIHHEIALLSLASPSCRIIKLHDVFQTKDKFIIIMEFAPGGDMQTIIDDNLVPYESDVVKYVQHVVEGLAYLHQRKIAHLDIKPQNLVMMGEFPDCDIKVCDFEISRVILNGSEIHEILGTPEYVAPEILHYEPITLAADMWSLGVTTYALLTGFSPFGGETDQETFLNISRAQVDFPDELFEDISPEAKDFVAKLLKRKPSERMSAKECLKHPWLAKHRRAAKVRQTCKPDCGEPRRVGCSSCPPSAHGLRNYLSKSREALFEKVISQQKTLQKDSSLRKSTLLQQVNKTRRLCESQMSLVSKSRERVMAEQHANLTRSREKLYGLRTLSKSHEVLNLYKSLVNLHQEDDKPLPFVLRNLSDQVSDNLSTDSLASSVVSIVDEYKKYMDKNELNGNEETNNNGIYSDSIPVLQVNEKPLSDEIQPIRNLEVSNRFQQTDDKVNTDQVGRLEKPILNVNLANFEGPQSPEVSNSDTLSVTESTTDSDISDDFCSTGKESTEEDEPRFTVKQLVSAYNKHQEIVTKTSLEVTMNSETKDNVDSYKFPTGPNALRLFIPDIKITSRKKRMPRKKTGLNPPPNFDLDNTDESLNGSKSDLSSVNARLNEILTLPDKDLLEPHNQSELNKLSRCSSNSSLASKCSENSSTSLQPDYSLTKSEAYIRPEKPSTVAKTVQLFNNVINSSNRPDRKSFSTNHCPPESNDKIRRKSSPPTMKPIF